MLNHAEGDEDVKLLEQMLGPRKQIGAANFARHFIPLQNAPRPANVMVCKKERFICSAMKRFRPSD